DECIFAADVKVAVAIHIERSELNRVGNINRCFPCDSGIGRAIEHPKVATGGVPRLVLEAVAGAAGLINREPLFVASDRYLFASNQQPGLTAVCRAPHIITEKCLYWPARSQPQVEESPCLIRARDRIAPEKARL